MKKKTEKTLAKITWKAIEIVAFIATMVPFVAIELIFLKGLASRGMEFNMFLMYTIIIGIVMTLIAGLAYGLVLWAISSEWNSFENQRHYAYLYFDGNTPETCREDILSNDFGRFMNACNMLNHWPYGIPHDDDCPKGITSRHIGELIKLAENAAREAFGPRLFQLWMTVLKNTRVNTEWMDTGLTACFSHGEPPYFQQSMIATVAWLAVRLDKPVTDLNDILQIAHMTERMATITHNSCKDLCPMDRVRLWQRIMELMFHRNYAETVCIILANYPCVYTETEKGAV